MQRVKLLASLALLLPAAAAGADDGIDYTRQVKPILARCYACHGALRQKAGLRLETGALIRAGGDSGPAIVPGKSAESLMIERVTSADEDTRMPPKSEGAPLTAEQIALLKAWIDQGAAAPEEAPPPDPRKHWAFIPPVKAELPHVVNAAWVANPIDAFVAAEQEKHGLQPLPPATKSDLLRRVYIDLIGLPPSRDELHAFLADTSSDAYEKVVDRLLASPRYGERWGRHWMDVWRYSDWYGKRDIGQHRSSRRNIWRWRDWIIESVNADKGYDRMLLEMLAGDEVDPTNPDVNRATGYLGRTYYVYNRTVWMQDTVEYAAASFLGLTFKCCRCHDHKYDPISQKEYYEFRAFFEPYNVRTDRLPGKPETISASNSAGNGKELVLKDGFDRVYDADPGAPTYIFMKGNEKRPLTDHVIPPGVPAVLGDAPLVIEPVKLPFELVYPELRQFHLDEMLAEKRAKVADARAALAKETEDAPRRLAEKRLAAREAELAATAAQIATETAKHASDLHAEPNPNVALLAQIAERALRQVAVALADEHLQDTVLNVANLSQKLDLREQKDKNSLYFNNQKVTDAIARLEAAQAALSAPLTGKYEPLGPTYPTTTTGRRTALAHWLADRKNPLTARVAVNHIWLRHFGSPLVPNVANFGLNAKPPTHPALLDWLAVELIDRHWSMKHMHRLMVTSNTYRLQSSPALGEANPIAEKLAAANAALDGENRYLWRANARRMEAEAVRDTLLALSGELDTTMGGPDLDSAAAAPPPRRSVYFRHTPDDRLLFLEAFDAANPEECYRRIESVVPQQALALTHGGLSLSQARLVARKLSAALAAGPSPATNADFVNLAFEHVLTRLPTPAERERCESFLVRQATLLAEPAKLTAFDGDDAAQVKPDANPQNRAREDLVHVLFNYHDFVTVR